MVAAPILVVTLTVAVAELLRVSFPLLYRLAEELGFLTAAGVVPLLFALPLLAAPLGRLLGPRWLLGVAAALVGLARVAAQVQATPGLAVVLVGVLVGLVALPMAVRVTLARHGVGVAAAGLFIGLAVDTGIRLAFVTWDPAWQTSGGALLVGTVVGLAVLVAAVTTIVEPRAPWGGDSVRSGLLVGPVLALETLALASPGFVASSAGVGLATAGIVVLVGLSVAATGAVGRVQWRRVVVIVAAIVVVVVPALATGPAAIGGWMVAVAVVGAQWAVGLLVVATLQRASHGRPGTSDRATAAAGVPGAWRTGLGSGFGSLVLVLALLPYQISYELELGVPQAAWPVLASMVLVALGTVGARASGNDVQADSLRPSVLAPIAVVVVLPLFVVPIVLGATSSTPPASAADGAQPASPVRVATYNLHSAVGVDGRLDPERIAQVLVAGEAEVMALQEVSRGWPLGGGLDLGSWLARRLGADMAWGPAADRQFGNAVLSTRSILAERSGTMPRGQGPMRRGWVAATVPVGTETVEVFSVHLQHQDDTTETRRSQARLVLAAWDAQSATVLAGDFNSRPGSVDIEPWFDGTGLVSAQEVQAEPPRDTSPAEDPDHRIDWILGTPDLVFSDVEVPPTTASDHLPIFTDIAHR